MNIDTLKTAKAEAKRFLEKVKELEVRVKKDGHFAWYGCAESGAVRRASMDLSRSLSALRKTN